jgi:hypothetical protein
MSFTNHSPKTDEQLELIISRKFSLKYLSTLFLVCVIVFYFIDFSFALFVVAIYFLAFYSIGYGIRERKFLKDYATSRGLHYEEVTENISFSGRLFTSDRLGYALTGDYNNFPVMLFYYNHVVGQGKNRRVYPLTVCEITFKDLAFPHILLQNRDMDRYQSTDIFGEDKDVEVTLVEGVDRFNLFTTNNYELEALQICTQDFLRPILSSELVVSLEFATDRLYIYTNERLTKAEELDSLFGLSKKIIDASGAFLLRLKDDYEALHEVYRDK